MAKRDLFVPRDKTSDDDMQAGIEAFLAGGGEIIQLKDDDGAYDKGLKKIETRLEGGFNPFSKTDALKK